MSTKSQRPEKGQLWIACPRCRQRTLYWDNPLRPFCSDRCKLVDLGNWADGKYAIPVKPVSEGDLQAAGSAGEPDATDSSDENI